MNRKVAFLGTALAMVMAGTSPAMAQFSQALNVSKSTTDEAKTSQQRVDALDDEANRLLQEYRANLKQFELLQKFNVSRAREVERQGDNIERLKTDVENVDSLQKAMIPLMEEMLGTLEKFIAADMPFLSEERSDRIARLRRVMDDSQVSPAQKYRLIVEAYQIENEYGRTIEAYNATVNSGEGDILVEFLRIGRVALIYKTDDDLVMRAYDRKTNSFVDLDKKFLEDVRYGLRMAKQQTPPDFLPVPVGAPK